MPITNVGSYGNEIVCDNCGETYNFQSVCGCDADLLMIDMTHCSDDDRWIFQDDTDPESRCICPECIKKTNLPYREIKAQWEEYGWIPDEEDE